MSRTRSLLFTAAVIAILTIATGLPASAQPPAGGFLLTGTDAAYADGLGVPIDGCAGDLFVGFVDGTLQQPLGGMPMPHSDVQAILTCNGGPALEGTVQTTTCNPASQIVSLESATLVCVVSIDNGAVGDTANVIINLQWTATGNIFTEIVNEPGKHAAHRTRLANLAGGVTINGTGGVLMGKVGFAAGPDALADTRITRFNEIQIGGPYLGSHRWQFPRLKA